MHTRIRKITPSESTVGAWDVVGRATLWQSGTHCCVSCTEWCLDTILAPFSVSLQRFQTKEHGWQTNCSIPCTLPHTLPHTLAVREVKQCVGGCGRDLMWKMLMCLEVENLGIQQAMCGRQWKGVGGLTVTCGKHVVPSVFWIW